MLEAAERSFGELGFRGASMEEIAAASGITKALLYQYFDSKEGLYSACVERARSRLFERIEAAVAVESDPSERLGAAITTYFEHLEEHRTSWFVLYGDASSDAVNEMRRRNAQVLGTLVREAVVESGGTISDDAVDFLGQLLVGAGEQIGRWWLEHPDVTRASACERFIVAARAAIAQVLLEPANA